VQARRSHEVGRLHQRDALGPDLDRARALDRVGQALEADPATGIARQCEPIEAQIQIILDVRRIEDRDPAVDQRLLALMRDRRGFRAGIVACQREHAAVRRGARVVGVLERVARTVDAGTLAVPDAEHAVVLRARVQARLLRAPHGGRGEILVHARLEADAVLLEQRARLPQRHVVSAERRAAISRDESARIEAGR
jgi:hypothetical protein